MKNIISVMQSELFPTHNIWESDFFIFLQTQI